MNFNRKKTRKLLFQRLYAMAYGSKDNQEFEESFYEWVFEFNIDKTYYNEMLDIIMKNESFFIQIVEKYSPRFDPQNMNIMYILPMYIGLAEMFYLTEEIPWKVSINESVEVAKAFWDDSAKKIVNWVLNSVYKDFESLKDLAKNPVWLDTYSILKKSL